MLSNGLQQERKKDSTRILSSLNRSQERGQELFVLRGVDLNYGNTNALKAIDLSIKRGEMLFITGPSGAGKTSLLRLLAQEFSPSKGSMKLGNRTLFISQIFQDLRLVSDWTIRQNVQLCFDPQIHGNKNEFEHEIGEIAQYLGLQDKLDQRLDSVSGGQRQKVAIMRTMATRPDVVLADEPTSSLDMDNTYRLLELFSYYNLKMGTTVVWASHNREIVKRFSGRILHLDSGRLIYSGNACFI
jgi:ABC-type ATPase involved in cell division